jgi:polar amino acid transport system substrate-binding protein
MSGPHSFRIVESGMTMKCILAAFTAVCLNIGSTLKADVVTVDSIKLMTEEYPPYNFTKDGELKGIAVDVMVLMLEKMKSNRGRKDIEVVPWARGYKTVLETPNTCLFTMAWTKKRSTLFKFVGPLEKFDSAAVFAKKSRKMVVKSYQDLKPYKIGVLRYDIAQDNLVENGLKDNIVEVSSPDFLAKMLAADRVDMWAYGEESVPIIFNRNGIDPDGFEKAFSWNTGDSYYAFNRETPDHVVEKYQAAFDSLKREKRVQAIIRQYVKR